MTIFFTSDTHLSHKNIIQYCNRPFVDAKEMDEAIIKNWNAVVSPQDTVYHLGDVIFSNNVDNSANVLSRLNGQKFLVKGNHDKPISGKARDCFGWVKDIYEFYVNDKSAIGGRQMIVLCHYPFLVWNKSHRGSWNLHGHCHGTLPDDPNAFRIDVGSDCFGYTPISYEQVKNIMSKKTFKALDHHGA